MAYSKILIAVDDSEHSFHAAKKGITLARQLNAFVGFTFVIDTSKALGNPDTGTTRVENIEALKQRAEQSLGRLKEMLNGNAWEQFLPKGHPVEEILNVAESWEADLIVMGTHGHTGLVHLIMGSTAEEVIKHARCPVMVVPPKK